MIRKSVIVIVLNILCCELAYSSYFIKLVDDSPIVKGATIHFTATIQDFPPDGLNVKYEWYDNAIPQHSKKTNEVTTPVDTWNVTYAADTYPAGSYIVQVIVSRCVILDFCYQIGSARKEYDITENLNGDFFIEQHNQTLMNDYVSTKTEVIHVVKLKETDEDFIKTAVTVRTHWFVDCIYYGITNGFEFHFNYTVPYETHFIEALVTGDFTPLPTTTAQPTTTTTKKITTTTPTSNGTTTTKPTTSKTTTIKSTKVRRSVTEANFTEVPKSYIEALTNGSIVPYNDSFPLVCNSSYISTDPEKVYGLFYKKFQSKDPLTKVNVTGNNWLQPGNILSLRIQCSGSKNFIYCVNYKRGEYNVTGNETCNIYQELDTCDFTLSRYLTSPKTTVLIIIKNDINKIVTPVTVNIYEVKKQSQLSVIVVPVAFSLVAVVLIVFGFAYYFQNRSRFIIEVADFNFGQQYSDMEYKTFRERLRDSIANAFTRTPTPSSSEVPVWPPGSKYGSMT